jgi:hypothetical protein
MGLALMFAGGCDFGCDLGLDETCLFGHYCPQTGKCSQCCSDAECIHPHVCIDGGCQDTCRYRCGCGFMDPHCGVDECCLGDPGCECCDDLDCRAGEVCGFGIDDEGNAGQVCHLPCQHEGEACGQGEASCCYGLTCYAEEEVCGPSCEADEDCFSASQRFSADRVCEDGICLYVACTQHEGCLEDQRCFDGLCLSPAECDWLAYCTVSPETLELAPGEQFPLAVDAYMRDHQAVPVSGFSWTSEDLDVVTVTPTGTVTAGPDPGQARVTAEVDGCPISCGLTVRVVDP